MFARNWNVTFIRRPSTNLTARIAEDVLLTDTIKQMWTHIYAKVAWSVLDSLGSYQFFRRKFITDGWVICCYVLYCSRYCLVPADLEIFQ